MDQQGQSERLTGKALLLKVKELGHLSRKEKARACGYVATTEAGNSRVKLGEFLNAVLEAKGVQLEPDSKGDGRGKKASYRVTVHQNGQIVLGATYTQAMNLQTGDQFEIKLGYKHIHLQQISDEE